MHYDREGIGNQDDAAAAGDGSLIGITKFNRATLLTIAGAAIIAGATVISGRLQTDSQPAVATAAAPTYSEGTTVYLSTDLAGTLRTTAGGGGGGNPTGGRLDSLRRLDTLRYLADGRLDSVSVLDTVRFLADGRLDSLTLLRTVDSLRRLGFVDSIRFVRTSSDSIRSWFGSTAPTVGQKAMAASLPVVIASDQTSVAVNLPSNQTVNVNQWGGTGTTLGQKAMTASVPVVIASDQGTIPVSSAAPSYTGVYSFALVDQAGVAAANNFICLFMPVATNDTIEIVAAYVETYSVVASITRNSLRMTRVTTCTVGTLQAAAAITKFRTAFPNATSEVRTGNPTVTAAAEITAFGPNASMTVAGATAVSRREWLPQGHIFRLVGGEGVVFRQTIAGDIDQTFNITIIWGERQ